MTRALVNKYEGRKGLHVFASMNRLLATVKAQAFYSCDMRVVSPSVLRRVVVAARATMLDLDPQDLPKTLVKVAAQTGKKLPPPMARRLLDEIDLNDWFREKVAAQFSGETRSDDPEEAAGALFLSRPDGWEKDLQRLADVATESSRVDENEQLRLRVRALEHELDAARNRAKRAQRETEMTRAESKKRVTAARTSARSARDGDREALDGVRRENATMAQRLAEMARDLADNRDRLKRIRGELLRERRAERPSDLPPARSVWAELDALGAARLLDEVAVALTPPSEFVEDELPLEHEPMVLPPGISPDDRSAVEWLLDRRSAFVLIVDGYNVTFLMDHDSFTGGERRNHLNTEVARFRRMAAAKPRVIVVYDSDQTGGITSESGSGGVEVRFTTAGHSADDEVLVLATELGGAAVVVSTDRRVREGAERVGALGLWSQALVGWISGR